ncbi:MAG: 1-acyl-sn-glycerol-3-phosphate acyltransferase [Bacteroidota bacterium]
MEKEKYIDIRKIIGNRNPKLLKWLPGFIIRYLERILHQEEINDFIIKHGHEKNHEICTSFINYLNIKVEIEGLENIPQTGGATFAMNHPLGGIDAIALLSSFESHRNDMKFIVNDLLLHIEPLKGLFVGVNKHGKSKEGTHQKIDDLFASGDIVCIFPAGMVSRKIKGKVRDLPWKKTFVTLSKKNNIPIIPIHISGKLSNFFYNLAKIRTFLGIKVNFEMLYLANEMFKQRNTTMKFTIGKPIMPSELNDSKNYNEWANFVREELYKLEK